MKVKWSRHLDGPNRIRLEVHSTESTANKKCLNFLTQLFKLKKKATRRPNHNERTDIKVKEKKTVQNRYQYHTSLLSSDRIVIEDDTCIEIGEYASRRWHRGSQLKSKNQENVTTISYRTIFQDEYVTSTPLIGRANLQQRVNRISLSRIENADGAQSRKVIPISHKKPTFPNLEQKRPPLWISKAELTREIQRLGALCEARTKELNLLKMQLRHAVAGFEAFSVLMRYTTEDLNAFSGPKLSIELKRSKEDLNKTLLQLKQYQEQIEDLKQNHAQEISDLTEKVSKAHTDELEDLKIKHCSELEEAKFHHEKKIIEVKEIYEHTIDKNEEQYLEIIEELKQEYIRKRKELEESHNRHLSDTIVQHKETTKKLKLQLKNLHHQYEELQEQAKEVEETLHKNSDAKMQWISNKKSELEKEVESLKAVLEMKQLEIRNLRKENLEMKKELEELPLARDKIQKLRARKEELEALMEERSRAQSALSSEHEQLKESYEKESKVNKRLSMEKEELQWKLQQSFETANMLTSLTESTLTEKTPSAFPTRLSSSFHAYTTTTDKSASHHISPLRSYRRSASLSEANISNCKKMKQFWDTPITGDGSRRLGLRSHSFLKSHHSSQVSKHPKHRSFTLHSGRSFTDHIKPLNSDDESMTDVCKNNLKKKIDEFQQKHSSKLQSDMLMHTNNDGNKAQKFRLPKIIDTSPMMKLFEASTSGSKDNYVAKDERETEYNKIDQNNMNKETTQEFFVVLETSGSVAAYKTNVEQTEDIGLEEASKFSDSIEGNVISSPDTFDNSNNVSCSLQSSIISDDSAWSSSSFPPQPYFDPTIQDFISPSSEDDCLSNSSGGSPKSQGHAESGAEQEENSSSPEQSRCLEEKCQYRTSSPKSLAGEAMVQDDSPVSISQGVNEEFSVSVSRKHKQIQKLEITKECTNEEMWEVSCRVNKEKIPHSTNVVDSPSMETTSQGLLLTNSNIDDISWDSEDMPSESEM